MSYMCSTIASVLDGSCENLFYHKYLKYVLYGIFPIPALLGIMAEQDGRFLKSLATLTFAQQSLHFHNTACEICGWRAIDKACNIDTWKSLCYICLQHDLYYLLLKLFSPMYILSKWPPILLAPICWDPWYHKAVRNNEMMLT